MSYNDLRDFACEYERRHDDLTVQVEKLGGGTIGKAYHGIWRYLVFRHGEEIARGQDYIAGIYVTHAEAARGIAECFTPDT